MEGETSKLDSKNPKVLIVDDIEINLQLLANILRFAEDGYDVISANNAIEGCEIAEKELPDLILMDWEMPIMSGIDAIKHLKKNEKTKEIPILMVTAYSTPELVQEAFDAGAADYLKKPVNATELRSRVKSSLRLHFYMKKIKEQNQKIESQYNELEKLAIVAEKTTHSFVILNLKGEIEWLNEGFRQLHSYSSEESDNLVGINIFSFEKYKQYKEIFDRCIEVKSDVNFVVQFGEETEKMKWLQVSLTPVLAKNGEIEKIVAIETNITTLKLKEEELKSKHKKLKLLTRFIGKANSKLELQSEEINRQKQQIEKERQKSDSLLFNVLPYEIAVQLKSKGAAKPRNYKMVSVLFTDFKSFSKNSLKLQPHELVNTLDSYFRKFDEIIEKHHLEKIKTIGDAYMCAGGLPLRNKSNPINAVLAGIQIQEYMNEVNNNLILEDKQPWELRLGIHTGSVIAGVIGVKKFAYDIWGKAVNIASRMESAGEPGMVNISGVTYEHIKDYFDCTYRGKIEAKNFGKIDMYFVNGLKPEYASDEKCIHPNPDFIKKLKRF